MLTFLQVSPHEFLQAVMKASNKKFRIGAQSDPVAFMAWLLDQLHRDLRSSKKGSSIIHECFQVPLPFLSFSFSVTYVRICFLLLFH